MATLQIARGRTVYWSSADHLASMEAKGTQLTITVPKRVIDSCSGACDAYLQVAHVWRDEDVVSIAQVGRKVSIFRGAGDGS